MKGKVTVSTVALALSIGLNCMAYVTVVLLKTELCQVMGYSEATFSLFFSLYALGGMLGNLAVGKLIPKLGIKKLAIIAAAGPLLGFLTLAFCKNVYIVLAVSLIYAFLITLGSWVPYSVFVNSWYNKGKATMMSLSSLMLNLVAFVASPVSATLISKYGAVKMTLIFGVFYCVTMLICALFVCELPGKYNEQPIDIGKASKKKESADTALAADGYDPTMPVGKLMAMPSTIICLAAPALLTLVLTMFSTNSVQIFQSFGLEYVQASYALSIYSVFGLVAAPLFGVLSDLSGTKRAMLIYTGFITAAVLIAFFVGGWTAAIVVAVAMSLVQIANMYGGLVIPRLYGSKAPELMGYSMTIMNLAGVIAAPLASAIFLSSGSWKTLMPLFAVLCVLFIAALFVVFSKKTIEHIRKKDELYIEGSHN